MKKILYIIVIVLALGGAGVMAYLVFSGSGASDEPVGTAAEQGVATAATTLLPYGDSLNFSNLKKYNKANIIFPYPKVNTSEIGKVLGQIIQ